jgi:hypothetical protein
MSDVSASGKLDIGRVIQQLFAVLGRNFVTFLVLSIILVGLPAVVTGYLQLTYLTAGQTFSWQTVLGALVTGLGALILQGTVIYATVTDLNGRRASIADCLSIGLRSFLPLLGIGILWYLAILCGLVLLIVPGLMILVAWAVCIPAYVAERPTLTGSFGRSAQLTRGNRWRIFALMILYFVALIIVEAVLGVFGAAGRVAEGGGMPFLQAIIVTPIVSVANAMIGATGTAVLYVELRRIRDGVGAESLASIFD